MPKVKALTEAERKKVKLKAMLSGRAKALKMSQGYLAKELGIPQQTYSYKLNHLTFTFEEYVELFDCLQVDKDDVASLFLKGG